MNTELSRRSEIPPLSSSDHSEPDVEKAAAKSSPQPASTDSKNITIKNFLFAIAFAVLAAVIFKVFVLEMFQVDSSSMEPTLLVGDYIIANKMAYSIGLPRTIPFTSIEMPINGRIPTGAIQRGDVVVFDFVSGPETEAIESGRFVKRVIALPGDTVNISGDSVRVGKYLPQSAIRPANVALYALASFAHSVHVQNLERLPYIVPFKGMMIGVDAASIAKWKGFIEREGNTVSVVESGVAINGKPAGYYTVRQDYYFVVGDNPANSYDSRYWGALAKRRIIGKAVYKFWSSGKRASAGRGSIRWDYIGEVIR